MKRPKGYAMSLIAASLSLSCRILKVNFTYSPARGSNKGPGPRKEKNVLIDAPATAKNRPMTRDRIVKAISRHSRQ